MQPMVFNWEAGDALVDGLTAHLDAQRGTLERRRFPDGESYVRVMDECAGRPVILAAGLSPPDERLLPLLLAAATLRDLGAASIGLACPYLPYMRQDAAYHSGEGVTARYVARLIGLHFDWLATIDPHLHRVDSLDAVYTMPTAVLHAAPAIAGWVRDAIKTPVFIGPDSESEQWVGAVARHCVAPVVVLEKQRHGDRSVEVSVPALGPWSDRTPVLVDDIISSGQTMVQALRGVVGQTAAAPVCIAVHGVFADGAERDLEAAGASRVVTTNTVAHPTNAIDVAGLLAEGCTRFL
ncbi:MAG: ribose-phosphate diphosphokinase [Pseudomonadota bacterium]